MSAFHDNALMGASGSQGYQISRSVRLRSSASAYFNRTFGSPTSGNIFTWSGWVKRGAIGAVQPLFTPSYAGGEGAVFNASNQISIAVNGALLLVSTAVYRDPSAWYHIMLVSDMGNATASLRFRVYVNGVEVTAWGTDARASYSSFPYWNKNTVVHYMGYSNAYPAYADGYMTEVNFIDGQALTPSSFGENDTITGVWKPKKYAGTYGTNGFYLNFSDNSNNTAATIGKDYSGNGNNWTPNNISVTSGSTYDSMLDVPTMYADGGNGRGNYAVLNPLRSPGGNGAITQGNLFVSTLTGDGYYSGTIAVNSGKWYAEFTPTYLGTTSQIGVVDISKVPPTSYPNLTAFGWVYQSNGDKANNSSTSAYGASWSANDVIGVAYDADAGTVTFYKNGSSQGQAYSGITGDVTFCCYDGSSSNYSEFAANFGQRPFAYTPPSGFNALNTQNLTDSTIPNGQKYFDATTYTGNGTNTTVTNSGGFTPDLVWHKGRSVAYSHSLVDSVRGNSNILFSNTTDAESNPGAQLDITTNGFISTYRAANLANNQNGATYVGWQWKAGGAGSSNTSGSITSTVSVNATAGFSVATFTAPASNQSFTVGHGLGVAPQLTIVKRRDSATGGDWWTWHIGLGDNTSSYLALNQTAAVATAANAWGTVGRNSTVCGFNAPTTIIANGTYVMYNWSAVRGYSAFGSYTGNGSTDGPFVFTNFRPRWIMIKRTDVANDWFIIDTSRNTYNVAGTALYPNSSSSETTNGFYDLDVLSNGFKVKATNAVTNASGGTYVYAAFCESPFKLALAR